MPISERKCVPGTELCRTYYKDSNEVNDGFKRTFKKTESLLKDTYLVCKTAEDGDLIKTLNSELRVLAFCFLII